MKLDKLTEATMLALRGKLSEVKGSSKTYTCIEDRQNGDFCVGATMTAEEWGETAMGWADSDGWSDPEEPLLKNFKTEQDCINFIDDMWEITIVPSDSPEAKEFLGEARSHKEDNEKVAPRNKEQSFNGGPNKLSNKASGLAVGDEEKANTGVSKALVGPEKGDIVGRDIKRNRVRSAEQALNRKNAGQLDFAGTTDMQDYEVSPNQKSREYRKAHGKITRENKKVTEATTDVNEVVDEYKKAYHKDLDLKTVPCVIARDKMLSGWGGAEGRNHYQVVLCADSTEAHNIASNMQAQAKREQLANVRVSFGVKLPSRASVAYCVGRYASAWNMGDSWYERYDKKEEGKRETILCNKIVEWAYDNFKNVSFVGDGKLDDGSDYLKFDGNNLDEFKKALVDNFGNNIEFGTARAQYAPEIKKLVVIIPKKSNKKTEKKIEGIDENLKAYTVTVSDEENQHSFQFYAEKDKTLDDVFNEIYDYVIF